MTYHGMTREETISMAREIASTMTNEQMIDAILGQAQKEQTEYRTAIIEGIKAELLNRMN